MSNMSMKALATAIASLLIVGVVAAADSTPTFTSKPTAVRSGDKVKIEFTADRHTDVAVYVEDAEGKVVRHLAAGVLGKNPPAPLKPNSLAQSLEWDGKDNAGKPAAGKGFKVRVVLGMKPQFDGFLLHNAEASGEVSAVAVGPRRPVDVFHR